MRIFVAGFHHETNTFAPSLADWAAFTRGDSFPPFERGLAMLERHTGINIPIGGFIEAARTRGWTLLPSAWAGAIPSSYVTRDAFERIAGSICDDVAQVRTQGLDAIYLDLHGAAVADVHDRRIPAADSGEVVCDFLDRFLRRRQTDSHRRRPSAVFDQSVEALQG